MRGGYRKGAGRVLAMCDEKGAISRKYFLDLRFLCSILGTQKSRIPKIEHPEFIETKMLLQIRILLEILYYKQP